MTPFTVISGRAAVLPRANIDTDQIIPARFLRKPRALGYHHYLFHDVRGADPAFPLQPAGNPPILIAGANFGCGSSREGAVYALVDAGVRCVIAPSFGDIFMSNAGKNGLLAIALPADDHDALLERAHTAGELTVDLLAQQIRAGNHVTDFPCDPFVKKCLLEGLDDIGLTLAETAHIMAFETADRKRRPWVVPD
jgi:3-isopropylmalate/(R)-2-methylmalate dehydratase small subunit